ncbi:MAG: hypothetical protein KC777_14810 [Cyanobacteria bacterium HKST-UBA02]|nr:hypothetical protein [Cyanobacteria bacterium HKST-UBA02]
MTDPKFTLDQALGEGWQLFKSCGWRFLGLLSIGGLLIILPLMATIGVDFALPQGLSKHIFGALLGFAAGIIAGLMELGWTYAQLKFAAGERPTSDDLWARSGKFWAFLGYSFIVGALAGCGVIALMLPTGLVFGIYSVTQSFPVLILGFLVFGLGLLVVFTGLIYLNVVFMFATFFLVDQQCGPIQALKASFAITRGSRWELFFLLLVMKFIESILSIIIVIGQVGGMMFTRLVKTCVYKSLLAATPDEELPMPIKR